MENYRVFGHAMLEIRHHRLEKIGTGKMHLGHWEVTYYLSLILSLFVLNFEFWV